MNRPRDRSRRGGALIEFALLFPVFFLLLAGVIDWGWMFYHRAMLDRATIVGCRAGSLINPGRFDSGIGKVESTAKHAMQDDLESSGLGCEDAYCDLTVATVGVPPGLSLECSANYEFTPLLGVAIDTSWMDAAMITRMEWQVW